MAEFDLSYDPEKRRLYVKEEVDKVISGGENKNVKALLNAATVVLYKEGTDYDTVIESLEILKKDIELRKKRAQSD